MNVLECRHVTSKFNGAFALNDVTLTVAETECVGVVGPNGAGKSTLANAICGLASLQSGKIFFNGVDVSEWSYPRRARLGVIRSFEDVGMWQRLSVVDNVALGARELPLRHARDVAMRYLKNLGIDDVADQPSEKLSLGLRRRVELARILVRQNTIAGRPLLVLDEPTRGLDSGSKEAFVELLKTHVLGRCPVMMIEHDLRLASEICSRLVHLRAGQVVGNAPTGMDHPNGDNGRRAPAPESKRVPVLRLHDIHAGYGPVDVLRGISLSLGDGEAVQLQGPNGSGKSTLLKVLVGSLRPSGGRIELFGKVMDSERDRVGRGLGYAPQGGRLIPDLTVQAHIDLAREVADGRRVEPISERIFCEAFPEVGPLLRQRAGDLSSGQRSLVAVWAALSTEPRVLLADEPCAGLSPDLRKRMYEFLRREWLKPGRGLIFVEHGPHMSWARPIKLERGTIEGR